MRTGEVVISVEAGTACVSLSNPTRQNAISAPMWRTLAAFAAEAAVRSDIRAVLIRGAGGAAFSAGADITDFKSLRNDAAAARDYDDLIEAVCQAIEAIPQPSVALVQGACIGAGASLAASCDLKLAEESAFFAVPAARLGLGYDRRGIARFLHSFGESATRSLLYTAERMSAARAYDLGVLHAVAPIGQGDALAQSVVARLAANAPLTLRAAKLALRALATGDADLLAEADKLAAAADASADYVEGRNAFAQKRTPDFTGT